MRALRATVHGDGDHGFIAYVVAIARAQGSSGYRRQGPQPLARRSSPRRSPTRATHAESAPAGTSVHAVTEPGIATKEIAEAIGKGH